MPKEAIKPVEGVVVGIQPNAFFKIQLEGNHHIVLAQIAGSVRRNRISILMGDRVNVELSSYDLSRGRITYRYK